MRANSGRCVGRQVELAEPGVEAQASRVGVAVRRADEAHFGVAPAGLLQEIVDEQQVVEFERQRGAAYGNNLTFFHT